MSSSKKMRLKIAVIGPSKSGKTSFINNICNKLHKSQQSPESYEVVLHKITSGNRQYEIQLWNCGSQHMSYNKYIRNAFFKNCSAAFLIFDLSKPFQVWKQEVKQWINEAYEFDCFLIYAIGTKGDYKNNRKEKFPVGQLSQSLNQIQIFQETNINSFFQEYQIEHFFQNATERVSSKIRNIFLKIQNDQYKLTRGSLAVPKKMESSFMGKDSLIRPRQQYNETIISIKQEQIQ